VPRLSTLMLRTRWAMPVSAARKRNFPGTPVFPKRVGSSMYRLRQVSYTMFLFLALLLHCSQTCLAAGHARAAVTVPVSPHHPEHAPCHSAPTAPDGIPDKCPDCGDHVFLTAASSGAETLAASGPFLFPPCLLTQPVLPGLLQPHAGMLWPDTTALSPPRYLLLSVLRL